MHKVVAGCYAVLFGLLLSQNIYAINAAYMQQGIEQIIRHYDQSISIGIQVREAPNGQVLYQKNADKLFIPASTIKIFTAAAALSYLGNDFKFQTKLLAPTPSINRNTLNSDVYFYFDGDPTLTRQNLNNLVAALARFGVHTINGNLYIDDSVFDQSLSGPGWMWDERNFCYGAPTSAISLDKNCFPVQITAAKQANRSAYITTRENNSFINILNNVTTKRISYDDCPLELRAGNDNSYYFTGCLRPNIPTISFLVAVRNVRLFTKDVLLQQLANNNIKLTGSVKFARAPTNTKLTLLAIHESAPLKVLVKTMLKKSDNLIADALFKKVGNVYFHKTATWRNSAKAVAAILQNTGINFRKMKMVDGSGLSRYDLTTPAQLVSVLRFAYNNPNIRSTFFWALPISGMDGTMKYRLGGSLLRRVHAKTGNMASVSSLAGYIQTSSGHILAFAIELNDFVVKPHQYHKLQDDICKFLARF